MKKTDLPIKNPTYYSTILASTTQSNSFLAGDRRRGAEELLKMERQHIGPGCLLAMWEKLAPLRVALFLEFLYPTNLPVPV